jgi:hypothetical protein
VIEYEIRYTKSLLEDHDLNGMALDDRLKYIVNFIYSISSFNLSVQTLSFGAVLYVEKFSHARQLF